MSEDLRKIIEEEIGIALKSDIVIHRDMKFLDGRGIQTGRSNGLTIAKASDQKIGFFGKSPVDQPETISDPSGGLTVDSQARTAIASIIDRLQELGLIK